MKKLVLSTAFSIFAFAVGFSADRHTLTLDELSQIRAGAVEISCETCDCTLGTGQCHCQNCKITIN